jgi:CxxC-x17-CxxC domain-containing protein
MSDFHDKQFGNHRPRKSSGGFGGHDDRGGDRQMFDATCVNCGKDCKVPFRPSNGKPVYCSDCFESVEKDRDNGDFSRAPRRNNFDRPSFNKPSYPRREAAPAPTVNLDALNQKFDALNDKLDLILQTLTHTSQE